MYFSKEADFEKAVIKKLQERGWEKEVLKYPSEQDLIKNWADILFNNNRQRTRLNNCPLTDSEMQQILDQIRDLASPLKLNSFINGKSITIKRDNEEDKLNFGHEVSLKIYDRQEIALGESRYQIVQQPKFNTKSPILNNRRGDLMLLINGMPVIHIELKRSGVPVSEAYNQIEKYSHEGVFRGIFSLVQIFVAMEPKETVYFANPGEDGIFNKAFYFHWANFDNVQINDWENVVAELLNIPMAHMLIGFYTIADTEDGVLKVMRSYQYNAAIGIADRVTKKNKNWDDGNQLGGHVWHTTGSGKTMTSFKSAQLIASSHDADKVVFLVDRKELGIQSLKEYRSFANENESVQATENTDILVSKLKDDDADSTLIVTSIQKMSNISEGVEGLKGADLKKIQSKRMVIIIDECHRSTFGEMLTTIKNTFEKALIFGFTGTPIQDVNIKKDSTTATIFGSEIHRYTLANGIEDGNVLGFDPYKVTIYDDYDLRHEVALSKAKAKTDAEVMADDKKKKIFYKYMDSSKIKMYGEKVNGKWVPGIEDYIPNEQYQTEKYCKGVIEDIKKKWIVYSRGGKFHAIFATSSIPEAVAYYRLMKTEMPELRITALFDPSIDNEGGGSLEKEDGIVEMLEDYKKTFGQEFTIPTYDKFRKDVSLRLAHKKPYDNLQRDEQIDILIVVNQMLTGFDSKWVNTLYLDKVMEYENLIQAFSRTNRIFSMDEKPFGIIKYYRRPHTMEKNIEAAVKAYSGDVPIGLFVDKLPNNLRNMNVLYQEIVNIFDHSTYEGKKINNFEHLPDDTAARKKFAKAFKQFTTHLEAALIQGFVWDVDLYEDEDHGNITVLIDEITYHTLIARYKELSTGGGGGRGGDVAYDIDTHITEFDTTKIDADYMNSKFVLFLKLLQEGYDQEKVDEALKELHRSYSMLTAEEQRYADIFVHDVRKGDIKIDPNKSFRDYISDMMKSAEDIRINLVVKRLGCVKNLLRDLLEKKVTKESIEEHGTFSELKESVDRKKAAKFFEEKEKDEYQPERLTMLVDRYLREFILSGGIDPYPEENDSIEVVKNRVLVTEGGNAVVETDTETKEIGVELTAEMLEGKTISTTVNTTTMNEWYSESTAVACVMESGCFAYIDEKLCINDPKYVQRDDNGRMNFTKYALDNEEECFLQFIKDENGKLHYVRLPKSLASKTFRYSDEITEDMAKEIGLVSEISTEMLNEIAGCEFGDALTKLMSKNICGFSAGLLKSTTGIDNRTYSNMKKGQNLTKLNVISTCLGIHLPCPVSSKMLELAELSLNTSLPGQKGADNRNYSLILNVYWATDYDDIYDALEIQGYEYLIHQPPKANI
ncbi:type I restriction endonuclease subunit R [Lachnospira multipara]|uniref:type I restriction endonuclease subunit R n=1 Tax=Lachnospira multipara TaxID=28051 RepID=UPI0004E153D4|nr:HsdR family type I site-specific deoxyribonuclease [Lachnospira multipara]